MKEKKKIDIPLFSCMTVSVFIILFNILVYALDKEWLGVDALNYVYSKIDRVDFLRLHLKIVFFCIGYLVCFYICDFFWDKKEKE